MTVEGGQRTGYVPEEIFDIITAPETSTIPRGGKKEQKRIGLIQKARERFRKKREKRSIASGVDAANPNHGK